MFKKTFFQIHWFLGITAGLILSLMGVTGAIYSYEQQILKWINQDSYVVQVKDQDKLSPADIYQRFQQQQPDSKINSITVSQVANESSSVNIVKEGERRGLTVMVNPYTAEVLPAIKGREFFQFIQQLHRNLTVGPVGKQITGACTLMLIFFVLSGLYLRWPKRHSLKQWFLLKPKLKGRNFLWDLHAVVGTWVIIFYLILACTGLYWSYGWWRSGLATVLGVEQRPQAQMQATTTPRGAERQEKAKEDLTPAQIQTVLQQSWVGFNQQIQRDYSTVTFTLPKKDNGEVSLMFVDAVAQHERARNSATFNYQQSTLTDVSLYEDKKLNEKIMSSMLPVHRGSFFGPIYQFMAMLASLAMPLFFVTGWMLYLKRRKQKRLTEQARSAIAPIQLDPNAQPWLIAYATQTGVSEQLAWATAQLLQQAAQPVSVKAVQQLSADELQQAKQVLIIASTYGTGEAPDLASHFEKKILSSTLDLSNTKYAVLALGAKEYPDTYCSFGHRIAQWFKQNQAQALFDTIEVNNADAHAITQWNQALAQASGLKLASFKLEKTFDQWQLQQRHLLNPNSLGAPAYQLSFTAAHDALWQAGDIAEIQPQNSQQRIAHFMQQHQLQGQHLAEQLADKNLSLPISNYQSVEDLLQQLPTLASREYSIASIPAQKRLDLVVRQHSDAQGELGLGSGWLTEHLQPQQMMGLRIRSNPSFHVIDDDRPIICIGNGTGIAGLLSILHTRAQQQHTQNWLIFGERQIAHDFFCQETLTEWQNCGLLQLDLAFSRDQTEKIYVHHVLRQHAEQLRTWIAQDAVIYVCGSIQGMATDVDHALIDILGENLVDDLKQNARYRRDVY